MDKTIKYVGTDIQGRRVYQGESGRLYCNTEIFGNCPPHYCTKLNNDFYGEPDLDMPQNWNPTVVDDNDTDKNTISINESQLRKLIAEKIKKVLKEDESDIYRIHNDRMTSFEKQMERLEWAIQDKERELEKLKQQRDQLQIDYEDDIQNFTDRWGDYSNSH